MDFINITYKGKAILEQPITSTLSKTIQQIQMLTDLPHNAQKLILFGKNINNETNQPLQLSQSIPSLKSKQKAVIMVIGSDSNALEFIERRTLFRNSIFLYINHHYNELKRHHIPFIHTQFYQDFHSKKKPPHSFIRLHHHLNR